jgi:hypothetical protein
VRIRHAVPFAVLLGLSIAGCTTVSPGEAVPTSLEESTEVAPPTSSSDIELPGFGAPKVKKPLTDTTQFAEKPCSMLTPAQVEDLGLPSSGQQKETVNGLVCEWFNQDTRGQINTGFLTKNPYGLTGAYAANERGELAYFTELPPIEGYPAVASDGDDRRPEGICPVAVGVTDELVFHVDTYLSAANVGKKDPCEVGVKIAGIVLRNMKGA